MKLDAGRYIVVLEGASKQTSKAGNNMIVATIRTIVDKDNKEIDEVVNDFIVLDNKIRVLDFIKCFGYGEDTKQGLKVLMNKIGVITITDNGYVIYLNTEQAAKDAGISLDALKEAYK